MYFSYIAFFVVLFIINIVRLFGMNGSIITKEWM